MLFVESWALELRLFSYPYCYFSTLLNYLSDKMGTCVGAERPQANKGAQTEPSANDKLPLVSQKPVSNLPKQEINSNPAAPPNHQNKPKQAAPIEPELERPNIVAIKAQQPNPAHPPKQVTGSKLGSGHQHANKPSQNENNSLNVKGENEKNFSWMQGSKTPASKIVNLNDTQGQMKEGSKNQQIVKESVHQNEQIAASWVKNSNTPVNSNLVHAKPYSDVKIKEPAGKSNLPHSENLGKKGPSVMQPIKEERQSAGGSSLPQKIDTQNSAKHQGGNQKPVKPQNTTSLVKAGKEGQLDDLQMMLDSEQKYGGISISNIKISTLHSRINNPIHSQPLKQSQIEFVNPSIISPKQLPANSAVYPPADSPVYPSKIQNQDPSLNKQAQIESKQASKIKQSSGINEKNEYLGVSGLKQVNFVKPKSQIGDVQSQRIANGLSKTLLFRQAKDSKIVSNAKQQQASNHNDSFAINQPKDSDQLQQMIMDEGSSPLHGILWRSSLGIK